MEKGLLHLAKSIVYEYDNLICVTDLELEAQGTLLDYVRYNEETDELEFWAGNLDEDDYAEQIIPTETELTELINEITKEF